MLGGREEAVMELPTTLLVSLTVPVPPTSCEMTELAYPAYPPRFGPAPLRATWENEGPLAVKEGIPEENVACD